ncbi:MAG TPA: hypothetical protein DEF21_05030 [Thalassospira lucentensis]|uniref:Uncharacterized protein n=2 Tax=Thalassospira lucentensis TaxID=168935 RepID=A0A358HPZ6_9PROT|nr:hypothetical protein [Thalassospira lucentensis]HCW67703.1 hypothetical protein [Thalassospira lucentensis]|tara:strand:- start:622 stop:1227 length:606 start_codon:yes stop_codon:yes gene_type:complete
MTSIPLNIAAMGGKTFDPKVSAEESEKAREKFMRQKAMYTARMEHESQKQVAWQNEQPMYSAIRLNGKLVGTMGINTGLTMTGISDGGAYRRAVIYAEKTGMSHDAFTEYAAEKVSQALESRYGASIEIEVFEPDARPTVGELQAEMFGTAVPDSAPASASISASDAFNDAELSCLKLFAQLCSQQAGDVDVLEELDRSQS